MVHFSPLEFNKNPELSKLQKPFLISPLFCGSSPLNRDLLIAILHSALIGSPMAVIYRAAVRCLFRRLPAAPRPRFYGAAAAQLEYDYESEWEEELAADRRRLAPATASWEEEEGRGVRWVFMGSPAAQKHVYATRVAALLDVPYISMGSLVRQELHPRSVLYKKVSSL